MSARKDRKGMSGTHAAHVNGLGGGALPPSPVMPDFKASFKSHNIVQGHSKSGTAHVTNLGDSGPSRKGRK